MPANTGKKNINKMTLGAISCAISLVLLFLAGSLPGVELTMYAAASFLPAFLIIEFRGKGGWLLYGAVTLLGFILLPNKLALVPYAFFFGLYGNIKYYIEKISISTVQLTLKAIVFLVFFCSAFFIFREWFFTNIALPELAQPVLIAGALAFLFLYDAIFTLVLNYYRKRIRPHLKRD